MRMVSFRVIGKPAQMGSKRAALIAGKARLMDNNPKKIQQWYNAVAEQSSSAMNGEELITGPVRLSVIFRFQRPKGHFGTGKNAGVVKGSAPAFHTVKPDLSKCIRPTEDAMSGVVYRDDSQVVEYGSIQKVWVEKEEGAFILVEELE